MEVVKCEVDDSTASLEIKDEEDSSLNNDEFAGQERLSVILRAEEEAATEETSYYNLIKSLDVEE